MIPKFAGMHVALWRSDAPNFRAGLRLPSRCFWRVVQ